MSRFFFNAEAAETQRSAQRRDGRVKVFNPVNPVNPMFITSFNHKDVMIRKAGRAGKCFDGC